MLLLLLLLFADYEPLVGAMPDAVLVSRMQAELAGKLAEPLAGTFAGGTAAVGADAGQVAARWSTEYAEKLAAAIADTTLDRLRAAREASRLGLTDDHDSILAETFGESRAESIGITETTRADTLGQRFGAQTLGVEMRAIWDAERDSKVCPVCQKMDGQPEELWGYLEPELAEGPPAHPNCLHADSLVSSATPIAAVSDRWFDGDVCVIRTAGNKHLTCTPNHQILTHRGWVAAQFLEAGDNVVCPIASEGVVTVDSDHQNVPARIEDVAKAFGRTLGVAASAVPVANEDFHGDGKGSKVAVVWANGLLRDGRQTPIGKHVSNSRFAGGESASSLSPCGGEAADTEVTATTTNSVVSVLDLPLASIGIHASPLSRFSFGLVPQANASVSQSPVDSAATDAELASQLIGGCAGSVLLDKVVEVRRAPFSGHVFNLETDGGWYIANGIIVHNCRCTVRWEKTEKSPKEVANA